jgi:hypothetical protein
VNIFDSRRQAGEAARRRARGESTAAGFASPRIAETP